MAWIQAAVTVGTGIASIFGGRAKDNAANDAADAQNEYNEKMYEYQLEERDRLYDYTMDQTAIARQNSENNIAYKEDLLRDDWKFKESLSIRDYNNQVAAFNKSEKVYERQLDFNMLAADQAFYSNSIQLHERRTAAQFNLEKNEATLGRKLAASQYEKYDVKNSLDSKRSSTSFSKKMRGLELSSKEAETAANIQDSRLKGMSDEGRLMARGQSGYSIRKGVSSISTQTGIQQARLVDGLVRAESQYKIGVMKDSQELANYEVSAKNTLSKIGTSDEYAKYDASLGRREIDQTLKSADRAYNSSNMKIANDLFGANLKADAQRRAMPLDRISTPKPLALPRPDIQDPFKPGDLPEPFENAGVGNMNTLGALSGAANNLAGLDFGSMFNLPS